jgi:hypothetical protein
VSTLDGDPPQPTPAAPAPQSPYAASPPIVAASPPPVRGGVADTVLKLSIALAFLIAGVSVGYYFLVYVPGKDARAQAAATAAAANATATASAQAAASQQAAAKRTANYNSCLSAAEATYHADWNGNCATRSQQREADFNRCAGGFLSDSECRETNPYISPVDCQLPSTIADSLNGELKDAKDRCLQQAKDGLLDQ